MFNMSQPAAQTGTILVADISGYTKFLTSSELDHGHAIVRELLGTVKDKFEPLLKVIRTEGDALFGYIPDAEMSEPTHLLDLVEATYQAFADHQLNVKVASTCTCNACSNSVSLDLKLVAHHAEFLVEDLGGGKPDLTGPEVILAHRLLKNTFKEDKGVAAYFLVTDAVYERLERPEGAQEHHESYEHFPEVTAWGFDLKSALQRRRNQNRTVIRPEDADFHLEKILPVTAPVLWAWLTEPAKMNRYTGKNQFSWGSGQSRATGSEMHCAHGNSVSVMSLVDWMPFEHYTVRSRPGFFFPGSDISYILKPLGGGRTRLLVTCKAKNAGAIHRALMGLYGKGFRKYVGQGYEELERILLEDAGAPESGDAGESVDGSAMSEAVANLS
jgi:class 3 adenylate cyclase